MESIYYKHWPYVRFQEEKKVVDLRVIIAFCCSNVKIGRTQNHPFNISDLGRGKKDLYREKVYLVRKIKITLPQNSRKDVKC